MKEKIVYGYNISLDQDLFEYFEELLNNHLSFRALKALMDELPSMEYIGGGSSRKVYRIVGTPYVIKIAYNQKGMAQNMAEVDIIRHSSAEYILPELHAFYENTKTRMAIASILRYYEPVKTYQELYILLDILEPDMKNKAHELIAGKVYSDILSGWINPHPPNFYEDNRYIQSCRKLIELYDLPHDQITDEEILRIRDNGFASRYIEDLQDPVMSFDLSVGDVFQKKQWGREGDIPKLLDLGFTGWVYREYYQR